MGYKKCEICNEYRFDTEKCGEIFNIFHEEFLGEEPKKIRAYDHEEAARKYGEYYDTSGDHELVDEEIIVTVKKYTTGISKKFKVSAEPEIHYSTTEIK